MMTIDEYRQQYQGISSSEVRELISTDIDFRNNTERLYESIYHTKLNKSCAVGGSSPCRVNHALRTAA